MGCWSGIQIGLDPGREIQLLLLTQSLPQQPDTATKKSTRDRYILTMTSCFALNDNVGHENAVGIYFHAPARLIH